MQGEVDDVAVLDGEGETPRRESDRLIGPEEARLRPGRVEIGSRRRGVSGAVEMFRAQHRIIDEDRGRGLVQLPPPRMGERAIDAVPHQRMSELEAVPDGPHKDVSHQRVADVARLPQQRAQMGQTESLAEDRGRLDGAPVRHGQEVGAGENDILNRARKPAVGEVLGASEQLLEKQRIAARPFDALRRETVGVDETPRDRQGVRGGERRKINGDQGGAAGEPSPLGVQRIALDPGRHRQHAAARRGGAGDGGKQAERLGVGPMDVLDRDEQRLAVRRSLHQLRDDAFLALRPGRRIHRFIDAARRLPAAGPRADRANRGHRPVAARNSRRVASIALSTASDGARGSTPISPATTVRTAPWPRSVPKSRTKPGCVAMPDARAVDCNSSMTRVLPIPASPRMRMSGSGRSLDAGVQDRAEHSHLGAAADEPDGPPRSKYAFRSGARRRLENRAPSASESRRAHRRSRGWSPDRRRPRQAFPRWTRAREAARRHWRPRP